MGYATRTRLSYLLVAGELSLNSVTKNASARSQSTDEKPADSDDDFRIDCRTSSGVKMPKHKNFYAIVYVFFSSFVTWYGKAVLLLSFYHKTLPLAAFIIGTIGVLGFWLLDVLRINLKAVELLQRPNIPERGWMRYILLFRRINQ